VASWTAGGLAVRERPPRTAKLRVYVDTSVIGGCEDEEFRGPSRRLVERCMRGEVKLVVSAVIAGELRSAPPPVRQVLRSIDPEHLERVEVTRAVKNLANAYIESGALGENMRADALHIATATVAGVDVLASWNFRHMVNLHRIRQYDAVNRRMGYGPLEIRTPKELGDDE
jgi:predicted nucleic acid-binding protein